MSLVTDYSPINQPEGTYPFALNIIESTKNNFLSAISSEPGTTPITFLRTDYELIGKIYFDEKVLLFSTDNVTSEIGLLDNNNYTTIFQSTDLNFSKSHYILGEHRILKGCEDIFYWSDGINPDRYLNLQKPPQNALETNILQNKITPQITTQVNNTGGQIESGSISFAIKYTNLNGDSFYTSEVTLPKPIYDDTISPTANGSFTLLERTDTTGGRPITNKSVTVNINNVDTKFPYIKLIVIYNNTTAYEVDELIPTDNQISFVYQGQKDLPLDIREVLVGNSTYITSLVQEQVQNRLVRANVKEIARDYSLYQREVFNVRVIPNIVTVPKSQYTNDPNNYNYITSFQGDEVYALGLQGEHEDGNLTPIFHIPGRRATNIGGIDELALVDFNGDQIPWFLLNNQGNGNTMGYYETTNNYPNITLCDNGTFVFPEQDTKIRHHKMPPRSAVPVDDPEKVFLITLKLENLPQIEGITNWHLVYSHETPTVLDSGYLARLSPRVPDVETRTADGGLFGIDASNTANFISPKSLLQESQNGDYFHIIGNLNSQQIDFVNEQDQGDFESLTMVENRVTHQRDINQRRAYNTSLVLFPGEENTGIFETQNTKVSNSSYNNTALIVNPNLENLFFNGAFAVNKTLQQPYGNLQSIRYVKAEQKDGVYYGDTFITRLDYFNIFTLSSSPGGFFFLGRTDYRAIGEHLFGYVESPINFALIAQGLNATTNYNFTKLDYLVSKVARLEDSRLTPKAVEKEFYVYNNNYSISKLNKYVSLPLTYDYCNRCLSDKPNRIIFSPQSFQEELQDTYLINKVNDYIDLPNNTGPIMGLKYKNNRLYVHTTQTTYVLSPNPQYISTNQEVAQLSSGDFLSVPPQEIIQSDFGYGGLQSKTATINTEFGYYWIDGNRGTMNHVFTSFQEISKNGMMSWFKNNLNKNSNIQLAFDPYYLRILITISNPDNQCQQKHTLSYNCVRDHFTSFHSYQPSFYFNTNTDYYSSVDNRIYRHLRDLRYAEYYGKKHPVIIEQVDTKINTHNLISIGYYAEFFQNSQEVVDIFTNLTVYNSNQSTGKLNLLIPDTYGNINVNPENKTVIITDKNSHISNLWDNSISSIVTEEPCNTTEYTDKVFVNTVIDNNYYNKPLFKEKYTISRLEYKPQQDRKVTYYLQQQNKQNSIR